MTSVVLQILKLVLTQPKNDLLFFPLKKKQMCRTVYFLYLAFEGQYVIPDIMGRLEMHNHSHSADGKID